MMVLMAACGSSSPSTAAPDDRAATTTSATPSTGTADATGGAESGPAPAPATTAPTTTTTPPLPPGAVIPLEVAEGGLAGGPRRESVDIGDDVTLEITSSIDEELHVHGYDVVVELVAGEPASVTFPATIPGVFEVELENSGHLLINLEVS